MLKRPEGVIFPVAALQFTGANLLKAGLVNALANTLIALFLFIIGFGGSFGSVFIFSQSIGMSIFTASLAAIPLFNRTSRTDVQLLIIMASVIFGSVGGTLLGAFLNGYHPLGFLHQNFKLFAQIVFLGLVFGTIVTYVFISLGRIAAEQVKRMEAEKHGIEAELKLLQSQMEPHFLFNTLSNVLSLIETDPGKARGMLEAFTSFLRASLTTSRHATIPLGQEAEIIRHYLAVFSIRMGDRLRYRIDIPDGLMAFPIPPLLIQPLVENAIKHGLEPSREGGAITVEASRESGKVRIAVKDTGIGMNEKSPSNGAGIGLENLRKRLELLFGGKAGMIIEENRPTGIKVMIEVPDETNPGDNR